MTTEGGIDDTGGMPESRFCNACGGRIETGAQFCSACGHRVRPAGAETSSTSTASASASIPKTAEAAQQRLVGTPERVVFRWILGSSLALGLGSVGPWATATVLGITVSASGLHGGGWVTLGVACASLLLLLNPAWLERAAWLRERRLGVMVGLAILAVLICVLNLVGADHSGLEGIVHPGWGLYLSTVAAIGLTVWAWAARGQRGGVLPDSG
jgi:hypothetical protein